LMRESPLPAFAVEAGSVDGRVVVAIAKCMALCGLRPEGGRVELTHKAHRGGLCVFYCPAPEERWDVIANWMEKALILTPENDPDRASLNALAAACDPRNWSTTLPQSSASNNADAVTAGESASQPLRS
jgi:hypothetical protein